MLSIPIIYNELTRGLSVSEEWAGTVIDDKSTQFIVSGIPDDIISARLDVKVAVKQSNGKRTYPFIRLHLQGGGVGSAFVPKALFQACKRDLKIIIQLELMNEDETYASKNWLKFDVSPAVAAVDTEISQWNQDKVLIDAYEVENERIVFRRFSGEEFSILLRDNPLEWKYIKDVPWRNKWSTGTPTDKDILVESFVHGELDKKTDILQAIPEWDENETYEIRSSVISDGKLYQSLVENNKGKNPASSPTFWQPISSAGGEDKTFKTVIGDGVTKEFVVQHDLGTDYYCINLIDSATGKNVSTDVVSIDADKVNISFNTAPATDGIKVFIIAGGGGSGTASTTTIRQAVPSDTWNIVHNKGRASIIQVYDDNMVEMDAEIKQTTVNSATIRFYPTGNVRTGYVVIV